MSNNPYADACKEIENIITAMPDGALVDLMASIDWVFGRFDGLFRVLTIGEMMEADYDADEIIEACLSIGATDYNDSVRKDPSCVGGWKPCDLASMTEDARFWADDAAEWLLDNGDKIDSLEWPAKCHFDMYGHLYTDTPEMDAVYEIYDRYWASVMDDEPAA